MAPLPGSKVKTAVTLFGSENIVTYGARLSTPVGTALVANDDSYENAGSKISESFNNVGNGITPGQLSWLTKTANNALTANAFDAGEAAGEEAAAVIGVTPVTTGSGGYTKSYTKAETAPGGSVNFKIAASTTIAGVTIAIPKQGETVLLGKSDVRAINSHYLQALPDPSGYKEIRITPSQYGDWTNFVGEPKTVTVSTGVEGLPGTTAA